MGFCKTRLSTRQKKNSYQRTQRNGHQVENFEGVLDGRITRKETVDAKKNWKFPEAEHISGILDLRIQGRKQSTTHFLAIKQSFYSLWLNCCHKSWTARGRLQSSIMFSATCRLIIVGHCSWSRWSNWTDVVSILSRGPQQPKVSVTVSLFWSQFHWQIPPSSWRVAVVGRMRPLWYNHWCMHQQHQTPDHQVRGASEDCGQSRRVDGASNRRHSRCWPGAPRHHQPSFSSPDWV